MAALVAAQSRPAAALSDRQASSRRPTSNRRSAVSVRCSAECSADGGQPGRRRALAGLVAAAAALGLQQPAVAASDFVQTASGLLVQDITVGQGSQPQPGDTCVVHWAGYTKNYQAKRIENTSLRDEPLEFKLGSGEVIPAFDEAVAGMRAGGVRRVEVLGELPQLSYPRDPKKRYVSRGKYRYGPQPSELGGQRALDFVLDNQTLSDTNRTLLLDIKLLAVRPARQ
ncbi:hypothetical protein ABPG75_005203 [Micractinium tetrahymenae]